MRKLFYGIPFMVGVILGTAAHAANTANTPTFSNPDACYSGYNVAYDGVSLSETMNYNQVVSASCASYKIYPVYTNLGATPGARVGYIADCSQCSSGYKQFGTIQVIGNQIYAGGTYQVKDNVTYCGQIGYSGPCVKAPGTCALKQIGTYNSSDKQTISNCTKEGLYMWGDTTWTSCETCATGYERTGTTKSLGTSSICSNSSSTTVYTCKAKEKCTTTNCISDTDWTCRFASGACAKYIRTCTDTYTCTAKVHWKCPSGTYGEARMSMCSKCPDAADGSTVYSPEAEYFGEQIRKTTIADCYTISPTATGSDATGTYEMGGEKCPYAGQ